MDGEISHDVVSTVAVESGAAHVVYMETPALLLLEDGAPILVPERVQRELISQERVVVVAVEVERLRVVGAADQGPRGFSPSEIVPNDFTPTAGQTLFGLSELPNALSVDVKINTAILHKGIDFTVSGLQVQLLPQLGYSLKATDVVQITFQRA